MNEKIKDFYTFKLQEFCVRQQKLINKTIRFYDWEYYPPSIYSVLWSNKKPIPVWSVGFKLKDIPEEIQKRFEDKIRVQNQIIWIIKDRNENYWYQAGMIKMETWMWKWNLATQIVNYFQHETLILVSNKKLQSEMIERFIEFSNMIPSQYGWWKNNISEITVCTKQSFVKKYKEFQGKFKVIIVDELHQWFTPKFISALNICFHKEKVALYGMSWTPYTQELKSEMIERYYWKTIDLKIWYSIIPKFHFLNYHNNAEYEWEHFSQLKEQLIDDPKRFKNQIEQLEGIMKVNKYTLILSDRIAELENFYNILKERKDYEIIKITWETKITDDNESLKNAITSKKRIVIVWSIAKVGTWFDFPILDSIFLIATIKFEAQTIQAVWRILRTHKDKKGVNAYVWNDQILKKQANEKRRTICSEYNLQKKDISEKEINKQQAVLWEMHYFSI